MNQPSPAQDTEERRRPTRERRRARLRVIRVLPDDGAGAGLMEGTGMSAWDDAIDQWRLALLAAGRSRGTVRLYTYNIGRVAAAHPDGPGAVGAGDLRRVLAAGDWKPETRRSVRTAMATFFRWAHGEGLIDDDPARGLEAVRVPAGVARPAPDDIILDVLHEVDHRTRIMILLARYAGLRRMEIATVHSDQWDGRGLYVTGKGGRSRYIPIVNMELRRELTQARGWLFPGKVDGHLSAATVGKIIRNALPRPWTAHSLRHRCATQMYAGTRDLLAVGAVLGHSRPETTRRYVRLPDDALIAAVRAGAA